MPAEKPSRLKRPWPEAKSAKSPYQGRDRPLFATGGQAAEASLDITSIAMLDTQTVTIDGKVYTFQTVLTDVDGNVLIGATPATARDNLIAAINLDAGAGTLYAASTTLHPTMLAFESGGQMDVNTKFTGTAGNTINVTETLTNGDWDQDPLENGADPDSEVTFVPIVQWGQMRIRARLDAAIGTGAGTLGTLFARPNRALDPALLPGASEAFVYTVDQPAIDGSALADGAEVSLEITATEHQGENWLKLDVAVTNSSMEITFLDIGGELLGLYH